MTQYMGTKTITSLYTPHFCFAFLLRRRRRILVPRGSATLPAQPSMLMIVNLCTQRNLLKLQHDAELHNKHQINAPSRRLRGLPVNRRPCYRTATKHTAKAKEPSNAHNDKWMQIHTSNCHQALVTAACTHRGACHMNNQGLS